MCRFYLVESVYSSFGILGQFWFCWVLSLIFEVVVVERLGFVSSCVVLFAFVFMKYQEMIFFFLLTKRDTKFWLPVSDKSES